MDATTFILRPSADISIGHTLYPEGSSAGYLLINEEVSDEDATYLQANSSEEDVEITISSSFKMSGNIPNDDVVVTGVEIVYSIYCSMYASKTNIFTVEANGSLYEFTATNSLNAYKTYTQTVDDNFLSTINSYISENKKFPDFIVSIKSILQAEHSDKGGTNSATSRVSQIYLNVTYNTGIYRKLSSGWKPGYKLYQKVGGAWSLISSIDAKSVLKQRPVRSGHSQVVINPVNPTCTTTGLTTGYRCSICDEIIVPQEVIPANGHNSIVLAGYPSTCISEGLTDGEKCSVCNEVLIAQESLPLLEHTYVTSGEYQICSVCGYVNELDVTGIVYLYSTKSLNYPREMLSATTVGDYAIFGGGYYDSDNRDIAEGFDTSLTLVSVQRLQSDAQNCRNAATSIGNYALFGGGEAPSGVSDNAVTAYDSSLTRTYPEDLDDIASRLAAASVGNYAIFGGGYTRGNNLTVSEGWKYNVTAYDTSLTKTVATSLSQEKCGLAATTIEGYALFGGGIRDGVTSNTVDTYSASLTKGSAAALSVARDDLAATTVGNYAIFGGGWNGSAVDTVDVYDSNLTKLSAPVLTSARQKLAATTLDGYALFGGGEGSSQVDIYDKNLTKIPAINLTSGRRFLGATVLGNYALFGGGYDSSNSGTVDIFTVR